MRTRLLLLAVLAAVLIVPAHALADRSAPEEIVYSPAIGAMIARIDGPALYQTTYDLQNFSTRRYPSEGNRRAATYIHDSLSSVPRLEVAYSGDDYRNVVATLGGTNGSLDESIVVGAHYDSTSFDPERAPGATDNGCGVAIVMDLARIMSRYRFDRTIQFAFWNAEEAGLLGSRSFARDASNRSLDIPLYLNYDSAYYDPRNEFVVDITYYADSQSYAESLVAYNSLYDIRLNLTLNRNPGPSDHRSFMLYGYPVIDTYILDTYSQYHTPNDTVELVSLPWAKKIAQLGTVLLAETADLSAVVPVPGGSAAPRDLNADGVYEDVNGNGRKDFDDVVLAFTQMSWIAAHEPVAAFDLSGNGRIDFADVVRLFATL